MPNYFVIFLVKTCPTLRLHLQLSPNKDIVPFHYQQHLVGAFHKWLGENELHDDISLYSLSWLHGGRMRKDKKGLDFKRGAIFSISSPLHDLHKAAVDGIFKDQMINWGMRVEEVRMIPPPEFQKKERFRAISPILIKRKRPDGPHQQYYFHSDIEADNLMTETLQAKLRRLDITTDVSVEFDKDYINPKTKKTTYKGIDIKANICSVLVMGDPMAVKTAWQVGIGNSTGIGFGCVGW